MLDPDVRAVLINALRPPPGMRLSRAVATTFTLDLEAAMSIPLAFASHRLRDPDDNISVMEAIRECADRIDIFAQAGQLRTPLTRSSLFAFLEPVVHLVAASRRLFHPKIWVVRYTDQESGEQVMRLLVLTRNLTSDRSWDLCLSLDGVRGTRPDAANKPIVDLVRWCVENRTGPDLNTARRAGISSVLEDIRRTTWDLPDKATGLTFHALGVGGAAAPDLGGRRHLAISPFLTEGGLARVGSSDRPVVISRQEELDRLPPEVTDRIHAYVLDEAAALKDDDSLEAERGLLTGLHAKAYVTELGSRARLTVGSANATDAGWGRNIEFLVQMEGAKKNFGIETVVGEDGMGQMLLPYVRQPAAEADDALRDLQLSLTATAAMDFAGAVSGERDQWSLTLTTRDVVVLRDDIRLVVGLLTREGDAQELHHGQAVAASFTDLATVEVTPFVVLTARLGDLVATTLVRATLTNDPADRLDIVLAAQVDSPEKFLRWLYLLLGQSSLLLEFGEKPPGGGASTLWERLSKRGLFEALVTGLADSPAQLADVSRFVDRVRSTEQGRTVLPPGFLDVWDLVNTVRHDLVPDGSRSW
jgi:hypothetical protein